MPKGRQPALHSFRLELVVQGTVAAVASSPGHTFSKMLQPRIRLIAGLGVEGDAHSGSTVRHRSRVARDPTQPNLRQVHLISTELYDALRASGFVVAAGDLGENITTHGIDLLSLSTGALLRIGEDAVVQITGLRNPCVQLDRFQNGLLSAVLERTSSGELIRKAGVMGIVVAGGVVQPSDPIIMESSDLPFRALEVV